MEDNRGDAKTNISKILYYGVMQNLWFNFMQQGAFMMGFGDGVETDPFPDQLRMSLNVSF